jgi:hypothetical protein
VGKEGRGVEGLAEVVDWGWDLEAQAAEGWDWAIWGLAGSGLGSAGAVGSGWAALVAAGWGADSAEAATVM